MKLTKTWTYLRLNVAALCLEFYILKDIVGHEIEAVETFLAQVDVFEAVLLYREYILSVAFPIENTWLSIKTIYASERTKSKW